MIQNKTEYFLKMRKTSTTSYISLNVDSQIKLLGLLDVSIQQLENRMEMSTLPNFGCGQKKNREITDLKERIQQMAQEIENEAGLFVCEEKTVQSAVKQYIFNKLHTELMKFKSLQQKQLYNEPQQTQDGAGFCCTYLEEPDAEGLLALETVQKTNSIRQSIQKLTNTLTQLKIALKAQTGLIDTIDSYFEKSAIYLDKANKEIEKLPGRYCGFKDYIIYGLLYIICILIVLIFVKNYKKKLSWPDFSVIMPRTGLKR